MGSLLSFLRDGRESFINEMSTEPKNMHQSESVPKPSGVYFDFGDDGTPGLSNNQGKRTTDFGVRKVFSTIDLIKWSGQIADAMQYLESKKVIHGDLATRNVLLTSGLDVKVTDFGLSRQLNNYSMYIKKQEVIKTLYFWKL
ncbi:unnamed protein product [Allacma fusca]|uniref:Protein kinase domain-containing protein n=1 Tax=Allacma fusca TaxID=39272 RepID=A0A8J2KRL5_9HEXA|nr:unnamed protein product [Allacma fusca]